MYGSIFREWKVAACLVVGIVALAAAFFADGGGYESLPNGRTKAEVASAPVAPPTAVAPHVQPAASGFTSDAELEAEFAEPEPPEASESAAPVAASEALPGAEQAVAPAAPAAVSIPAEQTR